MGGKKERTLGEMAMASKTKRTLAWHFLADDGSRRDNYTPKPGETEKHDGPIMMCESGLHASVRLLDALQFARGAILRRVSMTGVSATESDKLVAGERRELWRLDATKILYEFACQCADTQLDAAWASTMAAARSSARAASDARQRTSPPARAAAWAAARAAARAASDACQCASPSASDAAWAAARAAARAAQNKLLTRMVMAAHRQIDAMEGADERRSDDASVP